MVDDCHCGDCGCEGKPEAPADERDEPYYISSDCGECGTELVLYDETTDEDGPIWYDEWWCPSCEDGIRMDWPVSRKEELLSRMDGPFADADEVKEAFESEE